MISNMFIHNFKSIDKVKLDFRPITIFVGENSSGKSTVLQLLALLNQVRPGYGNFPSGARNNLFLGEIGDLVRKDQKKMEFALTFSRPLNGKYAIKWSFSLERKRHYGELTELKIQLGKTRLKTVIKYLNETSAQEEYYFNGKKSNTLPKLRNISLTDFNLEDKMKDVDLNEISIDTFSNTLEQKRKYIEQLKENVDLLKSLIGRFFNGIMYLPPFRGVRGFGYKLETRMPDSIGLAEQEGFEKSIVNILNKMAAKNPYKLDKLNRALKEHFQISIRSADPETRALPEGNVPLTTIQVKDDIMDVYSNIVNTGFGTNQVIAIGIGMLFKENPSIILIEEPEIHLHPKKQAEVFDFINTLRGNNTVVITTHSDHFLTRILQRIKQNKVNLNDIILYYFERTPMGAKISQRVIDSEGRIQGGMPGFLDHSLNELKQFIDDLKE